MCEKANRHTVVGTQSTAGGRGEEPHARVQHAPNQFCERARARTKNRHKRIKYNCVMCSSSTCAEENMSSSSPARFPCPEEGCSYVGRSLNARSSHKFREHSAAAQRVRPCRLCNAFSGPSVEVTRHEQTCTAGEPIVCDVCPPLPHDDRRVKSRYVGAPFVISAPRVALSLPQCRV